MNAVMSARATPCAGSDAGAHLVGAGSAFTRSDQVQETDLGDFEAIDDLAGARLEERVDEQEGIATIRANAVLFIAIEMLADKSSAFSAGSPAQRP